MDSEFSQKINCISLPPCNVTNAYSSQINECITSALKKTSLNTQSIIDIIIHYIKIEQFRIHIAEHINIPSTIIDTFTTRIYDTYKCIPISSISSLSDTLSSSFQEKPNFGDIILFDNRYHGFMDNNNIWISTEDRTKPNCVGQFVTIPSIITQQMPLDASYFYNIPFFLQYEYTKLTDMQFQFRCIQLQSNDIWLRQQLKCQFNELPSKNVKYEINLCSSSMTHSLGDLTVIPSIEENKKTFNIKKSDSNCMISQITDYLQYANEPYIRFKVRGIPDYSRSSGNVIQSLFTPTTSRSGKDELPSTWNRKMLVMNAGIFRYEFSAPKSQIVRHFKDLSSFMDPMFEYWEDIHVVVGIVVVWKWGESENGQWDTDFGQLRLDFEQKLNRDIFDIFNGGAWNVQFGADKCTRQRYNISDTYSDLRCNIYYGPKSFVKEAVDVLEEFKNSMEHAQMKPWVELITYEVQDPLAQIDGISY